jgi:hypothetical protein
LGIWSDGEFVEGKWVRAQQRRHQHHHITQSSHSAKAIAADPPPPQEQKQKEQHCDSSSTSSRTASRDMLLLHVTLHCALGMVMLQPPPVKPAVCAVFASQVQRDGTTFKGSFEASIPVSACQPEAPVRTQPRPTLLPAQWASTCDFGLLHLTTMMPSCATHGP